MSSISQDFKDIAKNIHDPKNITKFYLSYGLNNDNCPEDLYSARVRVSVRFKDEVGPYIGHLLGSLWSELPGEADFDQSMCAVVYMHGNDLPSENASLFCGVAGLDEDSYFSVEPPEWFKSINMFNPLPRVRELIPNSFCYESTISVRITNVTLTNATAVDDDTATLLIKKVMSTPL